MKGDAKVVTALALPQIAGIVMLAIACLKLSNCYMRAIRKEYSQHQMLVYILLTTETEIRKIKVSKDRSKILISYRFNRVVIDNGNIRDSRSGEECILY